VLTETIKRDIFYKILALYWGEYNMTSLVSEMIRDIKSSNLGPTEKAFLIIEWNLREHRPYELHGMSLNKVGEKIRSSLKRHLSSRIRKSALEKLKSTFNISDDEKALSLLIALAYFSYIDNEIVHDHVMRKEMLSKEIEVGFSPSEIELLYKKWTEIFGTSEDLFNKIFLK